MAWPAIKTQLKAQTSPIESFQHAHEKKYFYVKKMLEEEGRTLLHARSYIHGCWI